MADPQSDAPQRIPIHRLRIAVQLGVLTICAWMGIRFYLFVRYLESDGATAFVARPPGAEGFLPISSLMSVFYTIRSGQVDGIHPAGVVIFLLALLMSLVVAKSFCGWICPIGLLSDVLEALRNKILGKRNNPSKPSKAKTVLDGVMRSIKYLVLAFFLYAIVGMSTADLCVFLNSSYNMVADVKMYYFFANLSLAAGVVITILTLLSFAIPRFWCRYLCPYGALTGILGLLGPFKIRRNADACIDCGACARACPSRITVDTVESVRSDECISCYQCVAACPVNDALELRAPARKRPVSIHKAAWIAVGIFAAGIALAKLTGFWHNDVPVATYLEIHDDIDRLGHPRSPESLRGLDE